MNEFERLLMEEVRKHEHLYDCFSPHYKDFEMAAKSWNEISLNMGEHVSECTKRWKNLRDKYVRVRKRLTASDPETRERKLRVPAFYTQLSWLAPHVKHRNRDSVDGDNEEDSNVNMACSLLSESTAFCYNLPESRETNHMISENVDRYVSNDNISNGYLGGPHSSPKNPISEHYKKTPINYSENHEAMGHRNLIKTKKFGPHTTPVEPSPPSPDLRVAPAQKRKRQELEDRLQQQVARLEERRAQLQQQRTTLRDNDELSRFGQTVADMLRRLPEEFRPEAMFDVHKLLFEKQQQAKTKSTSS
ncbi:hypothetical protein ACEWY4_008077 [Coilia grayii]|uniref:MADF domain-containing protein n=1 Tax=Coilia grayii TaxID=363190 RepID=A0ABD1KA13_9TELE